MSEEEVRAEHSENARVGQGNVSNREKIVVFVKDEIEIAVILLDGKVEAEFKHRLDDEPLDMGEMLSEMHNYTEVWESVGAGNDCSAAARSADGKYFAKIGCAPEFGSNFVFGLWTKKASDYAGAKLNQITL